MRSDRVDPSAIPPFGRSVLPPGGVRMGVVLADSEESFIPLIKNTRGPPTCPPGRACTAPG